ncbi:response regulator [Bacillus sp. N9]
MYRILLVDDEEIERLGLRKIITEEMGMDSVVIEEAENGRVAIMKAAEFRPNIIFMDIKMPGIDGIEATEEIKRMDKFVKVIMVTAFEAFEYAKQAVKLGVNDYLLKPYSNQEIIHVLNNVINDISIERKNRNHQIKLRDNYNRALSIIQSREITSLIVGNGGFEMTMYTEDKLGVYEKPSYVMVLEFTGEKIMNDDKQKIMSFVANQLSMAVTQSFVGIIHLEQLPILIQVEKQDKEKESVMSQSVKIAQILIEKSSNSLHVSR